MRSTPPTRQVLHTVPTGVAGIDAVLGGGLPEFSFNMLAGGAGAGKTTLAQQILFANATRDRPALYFTVLGEPTVKMLRYQRQFSFFKPELVGSTVQYLNLGEEALAGDLTAVLGRMTDEVERLHPGIIVVDSFRTIQHHSAHGDRPGQWPRAADGARRDGSRAVCAATRLALGDLGSHVALDRRVRRAGAASAALYHCRRNLVALAGDRSQFRSAQAAGGESTRTGANAGTAYVPHYPRRIAGLPAHSRTTGGSQSHVPAR